jgi:hypothetical protein
VLRRAMQDSCVGHSKLQEVGGGGGGAAKKPRCDGGPQKMAQVLEADTAQYSTGMCTAHRLSQQVSVHGDTVQDRATLLHLAQDRNIPPAYFDKLRCRAALHHAVPLGCMRLLCQQSLLEATHHPVLLRGYAMRCAATCTWKHAGVAQPGLVSAAVPCPAHCAYGMLQCTWLPSAEVCGVRCEVIYCSALTPHCATKQVTSHALCKHTHHRLCDC